MSPGEKGIRGEDDVAGLAADDCLVAVEVIDVTNDPLDGALAEPRGARRDRSGPPRSLPGLALRRRDVTALRAWTAEMLRALRRVPGFDERVRVYQLTRFYRTLGMLLTGGISVVPALGMVAGLLDPDLRARLDTATRMVREGRSMSVAMESAGLTTSVALRLLRVGERSGQMGEMMERIATFHDEEMARWVDWFTKTFEPLLMAIIGVVIGGIVVLMYLPIFELAGSVQ